MDYTGKGSGHLKPTSSSFSSSSSSLIQTYTLPLRTVQRTLMVKNEGKERKDLALCKKLLLLMVVERLQLQIVNGISNELLLPTTNKKTQTVQFRLRRHLLTKGSFKYSTS